MQRDIDLDLPLDDADTDVAISELSNHLSLLSLQFPDVNLEAKEYIDLDNVKVAPTFDLNVDMSNWLDSTDAPDEEDQENVEEPDNEVDETHPTMNLTYRVAQAHFENLKLFLQDYDTFGMVADIKRIMEVCKNHHVDRLLQSNLKKFLNVGSGQNGTNSG